MKGDVSKKYKDIEYIFRKSRRARNLSLSLDRSGRVLLTKPRWVSNRRAQAFLASRYDWLVNKMSQIGKKNPGLLAQYDANDYRVYKESARLFIQKRLDYFCGFYGVDYNRLAIRNQKSRWGSCSGKKNLNFNYKLIKLPEHLADYIIAHEVCHLLHLNHSLKFWNMVALTIPDYKQRKKELRQIS